MPVVQYDGGKELIWLRHAPGGRTTDILLQRKLRVQAGNIIITLGGCRRNVDVQDTQETGLMVSIPRF